MSSGRAHPGALRLIAAIAFVAFALRALIPIGYMASLDGGRLVVVPCSGSIELTRHGDETAGSEGHSHHVGAVPEDVEKGSPRTAHRDAANCPFAASCCGDLVHVDVDFAKIFSGSAILIAESKSTPSETGSKPFFARGPPAIF